MPLTPEAKAAGRITSANTRLASAGARALSVCMKLLAYGDVTQKAAARLLTAEGFPKIRGTGDWEGTDVRRLYETVYRVYGLDAAALRRLTEEADCHENIARVGKGLQILTYAEWRVIEQVPRPPLLVSERGGLEEARKQLARLRKAQRLLKDEATATAVSPSSLETIEDKEQRQRWNEHLGLLLGRRRYHCYRLTQPFADSAIGNAIIARFAPKPSEALSEEIDAALVDETASIAIRQVLVELGKGHDRKHPLSRVTSDITKALEDAATIQRMKQQYPTQYRRLERALRATDSARKKHYKLLQRAGSRVGIPQELGAKLLDLLISNGIVERMQKKPAGKKTKVDALCLQPAPALMNFIAEYDARHEDSTPVCFPMIVPPKRWEKLTGGGFLTERRELVKTDNKAQRKILSGAPMPKVYQAINAVQETPFRINRRVLEVVKMVAAGPDAHRQVSLANMFKEEPRIYFNWFLDSRGRMYPVQHPLNPQADDIGKALLEFAHGKPLGKDGQFWLAVRGANCYGVDKLSFEDRLRWIEENTPAILASAGNPITEAFWRTSGKSYQFLAFCFEWADLKNHPGDPESFASHVPVSLDGSCNAYQHIAAMTRDAHLGALVNLVPSDKPQDLYQEVANVLSQMVKEDAEAGNDRAKAWQDKITRKITKPGVMTKAYGATSMGREEQLEGVLETLGEKDESYMVLRRSRPAIKYLEGRLKEAIGKVAPTADRVMKQLKEVTRQLVKEDRPVGWITPAGFAAAQEYPTSREHLAAISANFVHSLDASHLMLTIDHCLKEGITDFAMVHDSYATHAGNTETLGRELRAAFIEQYNQDVLGDFIRLDIGWFARHCEELEWWQELEEKEEMEIRGGYY